MPIKLKKSDIKDKIDNPAPGFMVLGFDERGQLVWKDEDGGYGTIVPSVEIGKYEILEVGNYLTVGFRLTTENIGLYSIAQGNDMAASGLSSYAQGSDAIAAGDYSTAKGEYVEALGEYSYVAGRGWLTNNKLTSGGKTSFVHSYADTVSGTWSDYSVILGGQNHNIGDSVGDSSDNSFILGGDTNYIGYRSYNSGIIGGDNNEIDNDSVNSVILSGSYNNIVVTGITNTVIIGGNNITATIEDAVYVPRLVLKDGAYSPPQAGTIEYDVSSGVKHFKGYFSSSPTDFAYLDGVYASTLDTGLTMLNSVGGYSVGTTVGSLTGRSFIQMFDKLLFPTIYPTYNNLPPFNTFIKSVSTLQEVALSLSVTFTNGYVTADSSNTSGRILLNGVYQNNRGGSATSYNRSGPGVSQVNDPSNNTSITHTVTVGNQSWIGSTNYTVGPQPLDNTGTPYDSPYPAGTTATASVTIEGVYPLFGTTSSISNPNTQQTLVSMLSGNLIVFAMVAEGGGNKQSFDIPVPWTGSPTNRPLTNVQTYNTVSSTWDTTGLGQWTTSSTSHTVQGNSISYTRYTYNGADRGNVSIRLVF